MPTFRGSCSPLLVLAVALWMPSLPLAAQSFNAGNAGNPGVDRYLRLDDGLYELNADGTYHKVNGSTANTPRPSSGPSRPSTTSSSGSFTGQERFMRFDDGVYERMADGTYTKVDERRQTQQSQSGRGASSTSSDPRWQQQFGQQEQWSNNNRPQQWSNNNRPQQWNNNNRPQQWSNNNRPQQWNGNRPQQWNNNQNQEDLRQLGVFLNALGGAVQSGGSNRPPRPSQQNFQAQQNFQPTPAPKPAPTPAPQPQPRPPVVDSNLQQGGNNSLFQLDEIKEN